MRMAISAALVSLVGFMACDWDECRNHFNRCVADGEIEYCRRGSDPVTAAHWERAPCWMASAPHCVAAPTGSAYCSVEAAARPDVCPPTEAPVGTWLSRCDGARQIMCVDGVVVMETLCGDGTCFFLAPDNQAFCSILPGPDPVCATVGDFKCADTATRILCTGGYRTRQAHCAGAGGCLEADGRAFCSLSRDPDPSCMKLHPVGATADGYCDGTVAVNCISGYPVSRTHCRASCQDLGYYSNCGIAGPDYPDEGFPYGDPPPECADGFDNDGDGLVDYPNDPSCVN